MNTREYTLFDQIRVCYFSYCSESAPTQNFGGNHFGLYRLEENEEPDVWEKGDDPVNTLQARTQWPIVQDGKTKYATVVLDFQSSYSKELPYQGYRSGADLKVTAFTWKTQGCGDPVKEVQDLPYTVYWYSGSKRSITLIVVIGEITDELEKEILTRPWKDVDCGYELQLSGTEDDDEDGVWYRPANVRYFNQDREDRVQNLG